MDNLTLSPREHIDYLSAENARLKDIIRSLTGQEEQPLTGLTRSQSRAIRALQAAKGRFVSPDALVEAVYWDRPAMGTIETVRVLICQARKRRPDIGKRIKVQYQSGYALMPDGMQA